MNIDVTDFYPRSPCGERLIGQMAIQAIHNYFYPRSPCGERPANPLPITSPTTFLSTLSLRRATFLFCEGGVSFAYFYPRSPCGERQWDPHT